MSQLTPEELVRLAMSGVPNCIKVMHYISGFRGNESTKSYVMGRVASVPSLINNTPIKQTFLKIIAELPFSETVENLLDVFLHGVTMASLTADDQRTLLNFATRYPDSRVPAILMLSGSTPPAVTNQVAKQFGFVAKPLADQQQKQTDLTQKLQRELRQGEPWENEQSGIIYGMRLLKNKNDMVIFDIVYDAGILPESLNNAILNFGSPKMAEELKKKSPSFTTHVERIKEAAGNPKEQFDIVMSFIDNPYVRKDKKMVMLNYACDNLDPHYSKLVMNWVSRLADEDFFKAAMSMLRDGKCFDVQALTSNEPFSYLYQNQLEDILKQKGLMHMAAPEFLKRLEEAEVEYLDEKMQQLEY